MTPEEFYKRTNKDRDGFEDRYAMWRNEVRLIADRFHLTEAQLIMIMSDPPKSIYWHEFNDYANYFNFVEMNNDRGILE